LVFLAMLSALASGCSTTATLYPIDGPLAKESPLPVITATADGITGNTGNISLVLPDGEICTGRWSSIAPMSVRYSAATASGMVSSGLASAWVTAYGSGFTIANQPGVNRGQAMLVGNRGTIIEVEFYTGSGTANGVGVAKDNRGNVFRMIF
jgi:hypothetical protein